MAFYQGREFYEDQDARISIMARANAQGPDTLLQTVQDQLEKSTCRSGAGHTFGTHHAPARVMANSKLTFQPDHSVGACH